MSKLTVCFSGHRPEKLPSGGDENAQGINCLKSLIYKEIYDSIQNGYTNFITGLARGVDNWAADMVIEFKIAANKARAKATDGDKVPPPEITLVCAMPYEGYGKNWTGYERWELAHILEKADEVITICPAYSKDCMRRRNTYMVDHSDKLIAVVSDYKSGTGQTIRYAQKKGIDLKVIEIDKNPAFYF